MDRSARRRLQRVGVRAEPHQVQARDPAAQSAPRNGPPDTTKRTSPCLASSTSTAIFASVDRSASSAASIATSDGRRRTTIRSSRRSTRSKRIDAHPDHYLLDGVSHPIQTQTVARASIATATGMSSETRESAAHSVRPGGLSRQQYRICPPHGDGRRFSCGRAVSAHDARAFARRVEGRDADAGATQLELHLCRSRRQHPLRLERGDSVAAEPAELGHRRGSGARRRATSGRTTCRSTRCRRC